MKIFKYKIRFSAGFVLFVIFLILLGNVRITASVEGSLERDNVISPARLTLRYKLYNRWTFFNTFDCIAEIAAADGDTVQVQFKNKAAKLFSTDSQESADVHLKHKVVTLNNIPPYYCSWLNYDKQRSEFVSYNMLFDWKMEHIELFSEDAGMRFSSGQGTSD